MAKQTVDATDTLNAGRGKINDNFTEVYKNDFPDCIIDANAAPYSCVPDDAGYDNALRIEQAIQDAYEYADANNAHAFVVFDPGEYYITRALQTTSDAGNSGYYCQIPLPYAPYIYTNGYNNIVIKPKGAMSDSNVAPGVYWGNDNQSVTFRSTLTAQTYSATYGWPSMFGGRDPKQGNTFPTHYSKIGIEFQGITFKVPEAPTLSCIQDRLITRMKFKQCQGIIHKSVPSDPTPEPTSPLGVFNHGPAYNNNQLIYEGMNIFIGLYAGPAMTEHVIQYGKLGVADCYVGFKLAFELGMKSPFHGIQLSNISSEGNLYGFAPTDQNGIAISSAANSDFPSSSGQVTFNIDFWDIETFTAAAVWNSTNNIFYIYDAGDILTGQVKYLRARANVGAIDYKSTDSRFQVLGCRRVNFIDLSLPAPKAEPLALFSDFFYRQANSSVVGNLQSPANVIWSQDAGTWGIINNRLYCSSAVASGAITANKITFETSLTEYTYKGTMSRGNSTAQIGLMYRVIDANNWNLIQIENVALRLYKIVAGVVTQIGVYLTTISASTLYELKIVLVGNLHKIYLNGIERISVTDSANAAGTKVGCYVTSGALASDNTHRFPSVELSSGTDPYAWNILDKEFVNAKLLKSTNQLLAAGAYINFGTVQGSSGYGFRDNGGTLEFKNSGGAWTAL